MRNRLLAGAALALLLGGPVTAVAQAQAPDAVAEANPLLSPSPAPDGTPPTPEVFEKALQDILAGCKRLGVAAGLHTFSTDDAKRRIAEGWQFIAVNSELKFMTDGAAKVVADLGGKAGEVVKY